MATKIKLILQKVPRNAVLFSSWLSENGIDRKEQTSYVRSGWIERISQGIYKFAGETPTVYSILSSYNSQLDKRIHIGASTALDVRGYSHFVAMGKPLAYIFSSKNQRIPSWFEKGEWDMSVRYFSSSAFGETEVGLEMMMIDGSQVLLSSPERAFMECLHLSPVNYSLMDLYYVMEMLTTLRPKLVQELLEACTSVKVKRLFLYMAEKSGHSWFKAINTGVIALGSGKRVCATNGKYIGKYDITIPRELADYE